MNVRNYFFLLLFLFALTNYFSYAYNDNYDDDCHYEKDIILEFKGAYFQPTNKTFKDIYHGSALFGPEVTFRIIKGFYGFASIDYFTKKGESIGFCTPTRAHFLPLGIGLKYLWRVKKIVDIYLGLGFTPTHLKTKNDSPYVPEEIHGWGFGGIAKIGVFVELPHHFMLDFFVDYSFVKVKPKTSCNINNIPLHTANLNGVVIGGGLGYRFD